MNVSVKSRAATALFAFFLGVFGVHRFYAGKIGTGALMLLLTFSYVGLLITGIWALIDFISALCGSFKDIEGKLIRTW
jgi:TM2 domain-containing membrane protein YozV